MSQTNSTTLSQDEIFDLLSSPRRRYVIYHLQQHGEPIELGRLADEVAAWENETSVEELTSQERKRVYVSLYQTHIPKLEEIGIVDYDADEGTVAVGDRLTEVGRHLTTEEDETRWDVYYLIIAIASVLVYAILSLNVTPLPPGGEILVSGAIMVTFLTVAIVHWRAINNVNGDALGSVINTEE